MMVAGVRVNVVYMHCVYGHRRSMNPNNRHGSDSLIERFHIQLHLGADATRADHG
jgi:hypothetical protein